MQLFNPFKKKRQTKHLSSDRQFDKAEPMRNISVREIENEYYRCAVQCLYPSHFSYHR